MRAVLTYHSIDASRSPISIDAATFGRHLQWLTSGAVKVVRLEDLLELPAEEDAVALTFDDGFANFESEAWPLLAEHDLPVTVFVVSELAGATNRWEDSARSAMPVLPLMGWDQLSRLADQGVSLGAHSRTHARLPGVSAAQLEDEVVGSKAKIERETGRPPLAFAYPYGAFDAASVALARREFAVACTAELRTLSAVDDPHELPRLDAYYFRAPDRLHAWGKPSFSRYVRLRAAARKVRSWLQP